MTIAEIFDDIQSVMHEYINDGYELSDIIAEWGIEKSDPDLPALKETFESLKQAMINSNMEIYGDGYDYGQMTLDDFLENENKETKTKNKKKTPSIVNLPPELLHPNNKISDKSDIEFINICKKNQKDLKKYIIEKVKQFRIKQTNITEFDGGIFIKGITPVLLTAHMDTVHVKPVINFNDNEGTITSPEGIGGDDRCGIYMILKILEKGFRPYILFLEDEEIGSIGSHKFIELKNNPLKSEDIKYMIELDRRGTTDAVFYDCDNKEFTEYIEKTTGFKEAFGSFSDISTLMPYFRRAGVNLSVGYQNEHQITESVHFPTVIKNISVVEALISDTPNVEPFEYIEKKYGKYKGLYDYSWDDLYYDDYTKKSKKKETKNKENSFRNTNNTQKKQKFTIKYYKTGYGDTDTYSVKAFSEDEAVGKFLKKLDYLTYSDIESITHYM